MSGWDPEGYFSGEDDYLTNPKGNVAKTLTTKELQAARERYVNRKSRPPVPSIIKMLEYVSDQRAYGKLDALIADDLTQMLLEL